MKALSQANLAMQVIADALARLSANDLNRLQSGRFTARIEILPIDESREVSKQGPSFSQPVATSESTEESQSLSRAASSPPVHKATGVKQTRHSGAKVRARVRAEPVEVGELEILASRLFELPTREAALELLGHDPRMQTRENLDKLAKLLTVYISKHDDQDTVQRKIIDFTVGAKLRSEVIQGLNLTRSKISDK
jgi:hypothetical protein